MGHPVKGSGDGNSAIEWKRWENLASRSMEMSWPFLIEEPLVGGVGGGGGAVLWCVGPERWGSGGGGGGMLGAVTVTLDGGGGAALVTVAMLLVLVIGGEGGLTIGGLKMRLCCVSDAFKQSCDWWRDGGVDARTGDDLGNRMLCALATVPAVRFNFFGGGEGFLGAAVVGGGGLGACVNFPNPFGPSVLFIVNSKFVTCRVIHNFNSVSIKF